MQGRRIEHSATRLAATLLLLLLGLEAAGAQEKGAGAGSSEASWLDQHFAHGRFEGSFGSGVMFSPFVATHDRPTVDYTCTDLQLGYMLGDVKGHSWWRGNFELAGEGFGSAVFEGPGGYIAGGALWLRYNFVPRESPGLVPFAQGGAGFVSTDIDRGLVGQPFNFNLGLGVGMRWFFSRNWALDLECRYQHISNGNLGTRNVGINACGPLLGVSYFF